MTSDTKKNIRRVCVQDFPAVWEALSRRRLPLEAERGTEMYEGFEVPTFTVEDVPADVSDGKPYTLIIGVFRGDAWRALCEERIARRPGSQLTLVPSAVAA